MLAPRFTDVRRFASLESTNDYLVAEAASGAAEGVVAVADHQTAGKGRLGRRWEAPAGTNLLMSILLRPLLPAEERHLATVATSLATADAAREVAGIELGLKWPNDLVAEDGRKVAGVLAEAGAAGTQPGGEPPAIVVGVGINVNWPTSDADLSGELVGAATSLAQLSGRPIERDALLSALLERLSPRAAMLSDPAARRRLSAELRQRSVTIGAPVRIELGSESFEGRAVDLTPAGHLVVDDGRGVRTVSAGDVVHLRPGGDGGTAPAPGFRSGPE